MNVRTLAIPLSIVALAACAVKTTPADNKLANTDIDSGIVDSGGDVNSDGGAGEAGSSTGTVYASYTEGTPPATVKFDDVCATGKNPDGNGLSGDLDLPFPFHFYQTTHSTFRVSNNGWLSFSKFLGSGQSTHDHHTLPESGTPSDTIYVLWETLELAKAPKTGTICYATIGAAPTRTFVVQWNKVAFFTNPEPADAELTFEARLNEADDSIDFLYQTITPGAGLADALKNVTIGIVNEEAVGSGHVGTKATESTQTPSSGLGIRFTPVRAN